MTGLPPLPPVSDPGLYAALAAQAFEGERQGDLRGEYKTVYTRVKIPDAPGKTEREFWHAAAGAVSSYFVVGILGALIWLVVQLIGYLAQTPTDMDFFQLVLARPVSTPEKMIAVMCLLAFMLLLMTFLMFARTTSAQGCVIPPLVFGFLASMMLWVMVLLSSNIWVVLFTLLILTALWFAARKWDAGYLAIDLPRHEQSHRLALAELDSRYPGFAAYYAAWREWKIWQESQGGDGGG